MTKQGQKSRISWVLETELSCVCDALKLFNSSFLENRYTLMAVLWTKNCMIPAPSTSSLGCLGLDSCRLPFDSTKLVGERGQPVLLLVCILTEE